MDKGAWQATVYRVAKSRTQLSNFTHTLEEEASLKKRERESLAVIGFPGGSDGKESTYVWSLGQEDPLERRTATHSSILKISMDRSLACYSPWGRKESDPIEWLTLSFLAAKMCQQPILVSPCLKHAGTIERGEQPGYEIRKSSF